jgi:dTDP-4-dehydrorhamnose reductase
VRILISGASGLLGGRLLHLLGGDHAVTAARHATPVPDGFESVAFDLLSRDSLAAALRAARPDAVVHSAAWADADACRRDPDTSRRVNHAGTRALAELCLERGVRLLAISTDLVLDGEQALGDESQPPRPILEYGASKLAGERAVLEASPDFAVLRVALLVGRGVTARGTASEGVCWALRAGRRVRLFDDQFRTPVDPESVADAVGRVLAGKGSGLYQIGGPERLSRHALGLRCAAAFGLDASLVEAARQDEQPPGTRRPADCSMDVGRAARDLGWRPRPLDAAIHESRLSPG